MIGHPARASLVRLRIDFIGILAKVRRSEDRTVGATILSRGPVQPGKGKVPRGKKKRV
jgi:hypothetical protein